MTFFIKDFCSKCNQVHKELISKKIFRGFLWQRNCEKETTFQISYNKVNFLDEKYKWRIVKPKLHAPKPLFEKFI